MSDEYKKIDVEFSKAEGEEGKVKAVFSVFNDVDSDGDVVLPTSIKSGFDPNNEEVPMVWAHQWDKPIGRGKIVKDGEKAVFDGEFFMDTDSGSEAYKLVKNMGNLQQWSFGFRVDDSEYGKFKKADQDDEQEVRYLKSLSVYEVSPVLVGANQDTFTMAIKTQKTDTDEKSVLTSDDFQSAEQDPKAEEEKVALANDMFDNPKEAEMRALELGCSGFHTHESDGKQVFMPCATHDSYESQIKKSNTSIAYLSEIAVNIKEVLKSIPTDQETIDRLKQINIAIRGLNSSDDEVSEKSASVQGKKRFSDEVKDVLAALNNLVARVQAIGELRQKNGRKLGVSATEALRTVQESVSDAFDELDKFVEEFGSEGALEVETQEVPTETEVPVAETETEVSEPEVELSDPEAVTEEVVDAQAETMTEDPADEPEIDTGDERQVEDPVDQVETVEVDTELDNLWLESQEILAEITVVDTEIEEEVEVDM